MNKVALITNIPAPYREKVYQTISESHIFDFSVIYCAAIEPNRKWKFQLGLYSKIFLRTKFTDFLNRRLYLGSDILGVLTNLRPSVVIVCGFSIPMIVAYLWAYFNGSKIISFTDGTLESESHLSLIHKLVRKFFYKLSFNCIGASKKSMDLIFYYRRRDGIFQSKLSIDTINFSGAIRPLTIRTYDLILCGQMIDTKMFKFSLSVIAKVNTLHRPLKVIILGDGVDREPILEFAKSLNIDFSYQGFVQQEDLFKHYVNSKIFLFPSKSEPWGIVANEACACGTPVITTPNTGCSGELILDNYNGYVLNPDVELWANKIKYLLDNENVLQKFSDNCLRQSALFTQQESADGIINAIKYAISAK